MRCFFPLEVPGRKKGLFFCFFLFFRFPHDGYAVLVTSHDLLPETFLFFFGCRGRTEGRFPLCPAPFSVHNSHENEPPTVPLPRFAVPPRPSDRHSPLFWLALNSGVRPWSFHFFSFSGLKSVVPLPLIFLGVAMRPWGNFWLRTAPRQTGSDHGRNTGVDHGLRLKMSFFSHFCRSSTST